MKAIRVPDPATDTARTATLSDEVRAQWLRTLQDDRARFLLRHPFTASLTLHLPVELVTDPRIPTAATNGRRLYFHIDFLGRLDADQRLFVMAHEVWHCVAGHLGRRQGRDPRLWNLAVDHEVNWLLLQDGFTMPLGAVLFRKQRGKSAEQVYGWLIDHGHNVEGVSFDLHELPSEFGTLPDEALRNEWKFRLGSAIKHHSQMGTLPAGLETLIGQQPTPAQVPWRQVLREFVLGRQDRRRGWERPARRHWHRGLWLPDLRPNGLRLMLAIDTSGSTRLLLPMFIAEIGGLMAVEQSLELTFVECDAEIHRIRTYRSGDDLRDINRQTLLGGGGTDLCPPFAEAEKNPPDALIYLTDGQGRAPAHSPAFPVMWVVPEHCSAPVEWGQQLSLGLKDISACS
ncbi:DUF2201 family putative metallopeptidase [Sphaerotilus sp.]|uniref:vWA domain-containing protein n=1 Tax=Sphaerotilus sp. TaxID=2093942 RepID=UPI002ACDD225|nr:VWA-like domain-containing protein [Sphaerotilus sp.]MDZ7855081.1 VWA-like domain-containing protein [Sphaerotilus sp.]